MASTVTGTVSSAGIGSGLDVNTIVSQLVSAERAPIDQQLSTKQTAANTKISALGAFQGAVSAVQAAAKSLQSGGGLGAVSAQSADSSLYTASAAAGAVSGSFDVQVVSLAQASKSLSASYGSSTATVGTGTITLSAGTASFTINLSDGNNTLSNLRDAINQDSGNTFVNASIVTDSNGAHLVLNGRQTGQTNEVTVSSAAASDGSAFFTTTEPQAAADAHIKVDGSDAYSASNTVTGVIDGVTLNLIKASPGTSDTLTLAPNTSSAISTVQNFVSAYNALITVSASLTKYDSTTKSAGVLIGDPTVIGIQQQLRGVLGNTAIGTGSAFTQLADLGITSNTDGTLTVDTGKLGTALSTDASSVVKLFSGNNGYASAITDLTGNYLGDSGQIAAETNGLQAQLKDITAQQTDLNARMTVEQAHYQAQFSALDTLISQMKSTQDYLTQQLTSIASFTNSLNK